MSRKSRHARLNPSPTITFFGDPLDRLLNGGFTDELRKQLPKETRRAIDEAKTPLVPSKRPLRAVFFQNRCRCGINTTVFGYFCREVSERSSLGSTTSLKIVEASGPPQELQFQPQIVPYCGACVPKNALVV